MRRILLIVTLLAVAPVHAQFLGRDAGSWLKDLGSSQEETRRNAAFALGKLGEHGSPGLRGLKRCLQDDSPKVREAAAYALGEIGKEAADVRGDPEVPALLTRKLKDDDYRVRRSAAFALGCLENASAQDSLVAALEDTRPEVRQNAIWALGKLGASSVESLRGGLADKDAGVRRETLAALEPLAKKNSKLFRDHKRLLIGLGSDPDPEIGRMALAIALEVLGPDDESIAPPLAKLVRSANYETRRNAALALSKIGGDVALPAVKVLAETLNDPSRDYRLIATLELGKFRANAENAVPALVKMLGNRKEDVLLRRETGATLQAIGPVPAAEKLIPTLLEILTNKSEEPSVRERVMWALRAHNASLRDIKEIPTAFTKVMSEPPSFDNRMLRYDCAYLLGLLFEEDVPPKTFDVLEEFLKDTSIQIYVNRTSSFSASGSEKGGTSAAIKEQGKGDGRIMAVQALARIGAAVKNHPKIMAELRKLAASPRTDPLVLEETRKVLKELGE